MAVNFVELIDIDGNLQSVNIKQIARIAWGDRPDYTKVDMIYLVDDSEVALEHLSNSSIKLAGAIGIESLPDLLSEAADEDDDEDDEDDD